QVEAKHSIGTWQRKAYTDLTTALTRTDKIFPCIYGTKGYISNGLDFVFLPSENLSDPEHKMLRTRGRNISLVLLCPPPTAERSVEDYHKLFWAYLKRMRELDPKIWPAAIPHATSDRKWCMNFDGHEAFFVVLRPAYVKRLSRYAPNFGFVYQPRVIFDVVFRDPRYREAATRMVRGLVDGYDGILRSPDISDFAVEGSTESRQYFLLDENVAAVCPYESLEVGG
ncbi:YqcI/YcgG family-domain-containing protein, partial [Delphinella strobiligena]